MVFLSGTSAALPAQGASNCGAWCTIETIVYLLEKVTYIKFSARKVHILRRAHLQIGVAMWSDENVRRLEQAMGADLGLPLGSAADAGLPDGWLVLATRHGVPARRETFPEEALARDCAARMALTMPYYAGWKITTEPLYRAANMPGGQRQPVPPTAAPQPAGND